MAMPAVKATAALQMMSTVVMTTLAKKRGLMRKSTGSAAHMRSASVCSVTTMLPISAAIPAPTRVASIRAPMEAARSRINSSR